MAIPIQFVVKTLPADNPGNVQELLNALGACLGTTFTPPTSYILGQMDGVLPQSNVGPWANQNEWWFYSGGGYVRGSDGVPVGVMAYWGGEGTPDNWLVCDGSEILRATYPVLFQAIGVYWGGGDGVTTFNLPPGAMFYMNDGEFTPDPQVPMIIAASNNWGSKKTGWGIQGGAQVAALLGDPNMPALNITIAFNSTGVKTPGATGLANLYPANQTNIPFFPFQVLDPNGTPLNVQAQTQFGIMPPFAAANVIIKAQ